MKKLEFKTAILFLILSILSMACEHEPPIAPPTESESLTYQWKIDTLRNPYGYGVVIRSLWGNSPNNVWAVGFNLAWQGEVFHYSNNQWSRATPDLGFNYSLNCVYGFSDDNIYAVGAKYIVVGSEIVSRSLIIRYNGKQWAEEKIEDGAGLFSIHGSTINNIWASGYHGTLYFYTGGGWKKYLLDPDQELRSIFVFPNNKAVTVGEEFHYAETDTATRYLYVFENSQWKAVDSTIFTYIDGIPERYSFGERGIWGSSETDLYTIGWVGAYKLTDHSWSLTTWDDYQYPYNDIKALDQNNIFIVGNHGTIRVLANNQWQRIGDYSEYVVDFYAVLPLPKNLFIAAFSMGQGYVLRGTK